MQLNPYQVTLGGGHDAQNINNCVHLRNIKIVLLKQQARDDPTQKSPLCIEPTMAKKRQKQCLFTFAITQLANFTDPWRVQSFSTAIQNN